MFVKGVDISFNVGWDVAIWPYAPGYDLPIGTGMGEPRRVYTNWLRTVPSPFEFALDFGYFEPGEDVPQGGPTEEVRVLMTWEYAKLLRDALIEVIETREGNVGEIRQPEGVDRQEVEHGEAE